MQTPGSEDVMDFLYLFGQVSYVDFPSFFIFWIGFLILAEISENFAVSCDQHIFSLKLSSAVLVSGPRTRSEYLSILLFTVLALLSIGGRSVRVEGLFTSGLSRTQMLSQAFYHFFPLSVHWHYFSNVLFFKVTEKAS